MTVRASARITVREAAQQLGFDILGGDVGLDRTIKGVYCCDLLSLCMARVPADYAWVTVMGNINVIAVTSLTDAACAVVAEGVTPDDAAIQKAREQGIALLCARMPVFEAAKAIDSLLAL